MYSSNQHLLSLVLPFLVLAPPFGQSMSLPPFLCFPTSHGFPRNKCAWCDSYEHTKSTCSEFQHVKISGRVSVNDTNRVKYWATRTELPQMVGKGGIKVIYERLMELQERLSLGRNYDPSCVCILQAVIKGFSAWSLAVIQSRLVIHFTLALEMGNWKLDHS